MRSAAGIQAQDPAAALLGIRARSRSATAADVTLARAEDRSIVRAWAMRGTLHLLATEDLAWQEPLFAEKELTWARRRMAEGFGIDRAAQDRASAAILRALEADGELPRKHALDLVAEAGIEFERASVGHHLARLPVLEGTALLGPERGRETTYVLREGWAELTSPLEYDDALAEIARRYLTAFGPATERDFAAWSGLGLGDCRTGLRALGRLQEQPFGNETLLSLPGARRRLPRSPLVRLLPAFDNHYLAHRDRSFAIDPDRHKLVFPGGGIIRATISVDGRAAGTWSARRKGERIEIGLDPFAPLAADVAAALEDEAADVGRFEGRSTRLV